MSAYQRVGSGVPGHSGERQVRHLGGGDADNGALDRKEVVHLRVEGRSSTAVVFVSSLRGRGNAKYPAIIQSRTNPKIRV